MAEFASIVHEMCEEYSDLVLIVRYKNDDEERECYIKCYKILLMTASPFFEDLIKRNKGDTIVMEESNIKLFKIMIDYMFTCQVDLTALDAEDMISLIMMSHKYKLSSLMELCGKRYDKHIHSIPDLIKYFNLVIDLNIQYLKESCLKIIRKCASSLFCNDSFMELHPQAVEAIIREDELNISELELFLALLKWAEAKYSGSHEDTKIRRFRYTAPVNSTANIPFFLQSIENELLRIVKVEQLDLSGERQWLLFTEACNNGGANVIPMIAVGSDDYWIKIRRMLDEFNITKNIRFLALDPKEFSSIISSRNILTNDEVCNVAHKFLQYK